MIERRSEVPAAGFRIDEETDTFSISASSSGGQRIDSLKKLLGENYDAIFVGSGAPRGRDSRLPAARAAANIHIASTGCVGVVRPPTRSQARDRLARQYAMDCCRTARRLAARRQVSCVPASRR